MTLRLVQPNERMQEAPKAALEKVRTLIDNVSKAIDTLEAQSICVTIIRKDGGVSYGYVSSDAKSLLGALEMTKAFVCSKELNR